MANRVRTHTRRTPSGGTARVQQHSRQGRPRKGLVSPGHAWSLLKRARRASRRKKTALAITLGVLGAAEFASWLTLDTAGKLFAVGAGLCILGAGLTGMATGRD